MSSSMGSDKSFGDESTLINVGSLETLVGKTTTYFYASNTEGDDAYYHLMEINVSTAGAVGYLYTGTTEQVSKQELTMDEVLSQFTLLGAVPGTTDEIVLEIVDVDDHGYSDIHQETIQYTTDISSTASEIEQMKQMADMGMDSATDNALETYMGGLADGVVHYINAMEGDGEHFMELITANDSGGFDHTEMFESSYGGMHIENETSTVSGNTMTWSDGSTVTYLGQDGSDLLFRDNDNSDDDQPGELTVRVHMAVSESQLPEEVSVLLDTDSLDDFSSYDTSDRAADVTVGGGAVGGKIDFEGDIDWIKVDLLADHTYVVNMDGDSLNDTLIDGIYDSNGMLLSNTWNDDANDSLNSEVTLTPDEIGSYYIAAAALWFDSEATDQTYNVSVTDMAVSGDYTTILSGDDFDDSTSTTGVLAPTYDPINPGTVGSIDYSNDIDWFRVSLDADKEYTFNLRAESGASVTETLWDTVIEGIYDSTGTVIDGTYNDDFNGAESEVTFRTTQAGDYYLAAAGYGSNTGSYRAEMSRGEDVVPDIANDTTTTESVVIDSSDQNFFLTSHMENWDDQDYIKLTIDSDDVGYKYEIDVDSVGWGWINLEVRDSNDSWMGWSEGVEWVWDSGHDNTIEFVPTTAGDYFIKVTGAEGEYDLKVHRNAEQADDFGNSSSNAHTLLLSTVDGVNSVTVDGEVNDEWDTDYFQVHLTAGERYVVTVDAPDLMSRDYWSSWADFSLDIKGTDDSWLGWPEVTDVWEYEEGRQKVFIPEADGDYFIAMYGYSTLGGYTLTVEEEDLSAKDDFGSSESVTESPAVGTFGRYEDEGDNRQFVSYNEIYEQSDAHDEEKDYTMNAGALDYQDDLDWFKFDVTTEEAEADTVFKFILKERDRGGDGSVEQPWDDWTWMDLGIFDSQGNQIWDWDNIENFSVWDADGNWDTLDKSILKFNPETAGTYYVQVSGQSGNEYALIAKKNTLVDDFADYEYIDAPLHGYDAAGVGALTLATDGTATIDGEFEQSDDSDLFKVTLNANERYTVLLEGRDADNDGWDDLSKWDMGLRLSKWNDDKTEIVELDWNEYDEDWGYDEGQRLTLSGTGQELFIRTETWWDDGGYTLSVESMGQDIGDSTSANEVLQFTDDVAEVNSTVGYQNDHDWFKFTADAEKVYVITVDSDVIWPSLDVKDSNGDWLWDGVTWDWSYDDSLMANQQRVIFSPTTAGDYYVDVGSWDEGRYHLTVEAQVNEDDYGSSTGDHGTITVNSAISGAKLNSTYDRDWFQFTVEESDLSQDKSFTFTMDVKSVDGVNEWGDSWAWASLNVIQMQQDSWGEWENWMWDGVSSDWNYNPDDNWDTPDQRLFFKPTEAGTYYLNVDGDAPITYDLKMSAERVVDDFGSTTSDYGEITVDADNETIGKTERAGDRDWFQFTAEANQSYVITLDPYADGSGNNIQWPSMEVLDSNGWWLWDGVNYDWNYDPTPNDWNSDGERIIFTASSADEYFISVNNWEEGSYSLSIDKQAADDYASNTTTLGLLTVGSSLDGALTSGDSDWFKFEISSDDVTKGKTFALNLTSEGMEWPWLDINDQWGYYIWDGVNYDWSYDDGDANTTADERILFTPTQAGTFYLTVGGSETGNYTVSMDTYELVDDYGNTASNHGVFATIDADDSSADGLISGELETSFDNDWFKIDATAGTTYEVTLNSTATDSLYIDVMDRYGNWMWDGVDWDWNNNTFDERLTFTPDETGTYYLNVGGWDKGVYELGFSELTGSGDDFASTWDQVRFYPEAFAGGEAADEQVFGELDVNVTSSGSIETYGDIDWFKVTLERDASYTFDVTSATDGYTRLDTTIEGFYDSVGNRIDHSYDDDGGEGLDSQLVINVDESGVARVARTQNEHIFAEDTYFIAVSAWSAGDYNVLVTKNVTTEAVTISEDTNTTGSLTIGDSKEGTIDFSYDQDWYKVTLLADTEYRFSLKGEESGVGTLQDTYIKGIFDSNGDLIDNTENDDANYSLESEVTYTATEDGIYYISAAAYGDLTGTYALSMTQVSSSEVVVAEESAGTDTTGEMVIGEYTTAAIEPAGDQDWFKVSLDADTTYEINMYGDSTGQGTLIDPLIQGIYDSTGTVISSTSNNDGGHQFDAYIEFTTDDTGGDYYIATESAISTGTGTYKLKVDEKAQEQAQAEAVSTVATTFTEGDGSWTIMVYLAADNNLEAMGLDDINEMELGKSALPDNVNVTFIIDRAEDHSAAEGDWTDTRRGVIESDTDILSIGSTMESVGEKNMGDAQTLTDFIDWSTSVAAADNYALVVWDHGGGISGVAWDETDGNDNLSISEVTQSVQASSVGTDGGSFEMIGFDACLQGVIDQSYALKDVADVVVSSEELEPGDGWDYTGWFEGLTGDTDITTSDMAQTVVESYGEFYEDYQWLDATLSAVDTSKLSDYDSNGDGTADTSGVITEMTAFNGALNGIDQADLNSIDRAMIGVTEFGGSYGGYMDLGGIADAIDGLDITTNDLDTKAQALSAAIDNAVLFNTSTAVGASGMSVYTGAYTDYYVDSFEVASTTNINELYDVIG